MKLIASFLMTLLTFFVYGQKSNTLQAPKVDERIELLSIVFRLADSKEYSSTIFNQYTDKIETHYAAYKNHELIQFTKKIRYENGIGYDAVMSMAIHLDKNLNPRVNLSSKTLDKRWGKENATEFTRLLKKFYKDSNSKVFFKTNQELYSSSTEKFLPIYENLDLDWYSRFYGTKPTEKFIIINGLSIGGSNFGPDIVLKNKQREVYAIMGTWKVDANGNPKFDFDSYFPILLHEFNHSFINHLLENNKENFRQNGETLYEVFEEKMNDQAYGNWETMLNEALVRAAVIKYMKDHNFSEAQIKEEISEQIDRGFLWIEDLVYELDNYDKQRDKYPTLQTYMPVLVKAYDEYVKNIDKYKEILKK